MWQMLDSAIYLIITLHIWILMTLAPSLVFEIFPEKIIGYLTCIGCLKCIDSPIIPKFVTAPSKSSIKLLSQANWSAFRYLTDKSPIILNVDSLQVLIVFGFYKVIDQYRNSAIEQGFPSL